MIVLDASAAVNIVRDTEEGQVLQQLMLNNESCHAPYLFVGEVGHVFEKYARGKSGDKDEALKLFANALELVDEFHPDIELSTEMLSESLRLRHSSYDLEYLVLARRLGATLFTLDKRLQMLALKNGVNSIATMDLE